MKEINKQWQRCNGVRETVMSGVGVRPYSMENLFFNVYAHVLCNRCSKIDGSHQEGWVRNHLKRSRWHTIGTLRDGLNSSKEPVGDVELW